MNMLTYSYGAFLLGLIVELWMITRNFRLMATLVAIGLGGSLFVFLPGKREGHYVWQNHVNMWPLGLAFSAIFGAVFVLGKRLLAPLDEGSSLIFGIVYVYWLVEKDFFWSMSLSHKGLLLLPVVPVFMAALMTFELGSRWRAYFGTLNSILVLLFGIEFMIRIAQLEKVEDLLIQNRWDFAIEVAFDHFFLGTACLYLGYHFFVLMAFIPGKHSFFNARYFENLRENLQDQADRFSPDQIPVPLAVACLIFFGGFLAFNHLEQAVPSSLAISAVLTLGSPLFWLAHRTLLRFFP